MVEVNATQMVTLIVNRLKELLGELEPLISSQLDASNLEKYIHLKKGKKGVSCREGITY